MQHESVLQSSQPYPYYSGVTPVSVALSSQTNGQATNSKIMTTQPNAMFNFVIPGQTSQYSGLYGTQTVFPNSNLFSPSSFNGFGQLDPTWLPQPRLIPPSVHSANGSPADLLSNTRNPYEKFDASNSPSCCSRIGTIDNTTIGMCSPLTAEAYKVVSKELQSKIDSQNWYCSSQSMMGFGVQNSQQSCKYSDPPPSCSISLLLLEQNDLKQTEECINVDDLCFDTPKSDSKSDIKSFSSCMEIEKNELNDEINDENIDLESLTTSEESDIIVEESESETTVSSPAAPELSLRCLVCDKVAPLHSLNSFIRLNDEMPLTTTTHVSILSKLSQVIDNNFNKLKDCSICPRCLNSVNIVDKLEIKLNLAKKELVDMYKSKESVEEVKEQKSEQGESLSESKLLCQICNKKFSSISYLEKHKQYHTKNYSYYCEYCGKGFAVLQKLENHLILHSNSSRFQCELCGKRYIQKHALIDHIKKHKGEYRYKCGVCQKGFVRKSVYKIHLQIHSTESLICQYCGKQFKNAANLSVHIKMCSGDLKFTCSKCDKKFPIKSLLKKHISTKHDLKFDYYCNVCMKGFTKKSDLKNHLRSHSDDKPFKCEKCSNSYKSLSNLNQHLKMHSSSKVLECNVCNKQFTRKDSLKDHMNQHTGNKPYKCGTCWKTFANKINFNSHVKRHQGVLKQTPCPICNKLFTKGLKDHMTTHSGEKPYSCKHCMAVFSVKSSLNKHVKTKHNISNGA